MTSKTVAAVTTCFPKQIGVRVWIRVQEKGSRSGGLRRRPEIRSYVVGGRVAHIGYFRHEFVGRRKWFDERTYADVVALCQLLPGPASSQVGMASDYHAQGFWVHWQPGPAFTLPSAIALVLFAYGLLRYGNALGAGWLHGLKAAAVAVVALAVLIHGGRFQAVALPW